MSRRGLISISMPYLMVLLIAIGLFVLALFASEALSQEVEESVNDLGRISSANFYTESFFYDTLPLGSAYSLHQASYELGSAGGGENISWNEETLVRAPPGGQEGNEIKVLGSIQQNFRQSSGRYLREKYPTSDTGTVCSLENPIEPEIAHQNGLPTNRDQQNVSFRVQVPEISTTCDFSGGEVGYKGSSESFHAADRADDNRYLTMANRTASFFNALRQEFVSVNNQYSGAAGQDGHSYCGEQYEATSDAESRAVSNAENAVSSSFSSAVSSYPDSDGLVYVVREIVSSESFSRSFASNWEGSVETSSEQESCCETVEGSCVANYWSATSTAYPSFSEVEYSLKDDRYRIPTEEGWEPLFFNVTVYSHDYQND